jgi:hypothetical protein
MFIHGLVGVIGCRGWKVVTEPHRLTLAVVDDDVDVRAALGRLSIASSSTSVSPG